jgi:hypothetical protein
MTTGHEHELIYDLETGIGWALGAVLVLFARPVVWLIFHDWNEQRRAWQKWRAR